MADVRLTATNPEDSSVVPVACNSKGELLVDKPNIEQIDNNVTIAGDLVIDNSYDGGNGLIWNFSQENKTLTGRSNLDDVYSHEFYLSGLVKHVRKLNDEYREVGICLSGAAIRVSSESNDSIYSISWNGVAEGSNFRIMLEPDNPIHYSSVRNTETGEETKEYIGPVMNVRDELEFLRNQVRALMEKLKMTPEGGWEVWDGSTET